MERSIFNKAPKSPGVYALYGGNTRKKYVAYVGIANNIRQRFFQHFIRRDSSIVTGVSAISLNPEKITEVRWWEFSDEDARYLREAEVVAFDILDPVLRSRAPISPPVQYIANSEEFKSKMEQKFSGEPSGIIKILSYQELISKVFELEKIVKRIK
ncbi:MAG: GIY-YIG nuclease family protein [Ignavibacterium sp.]|nr:GIY-YIG nuclease family protein [Ignavibacterium sp.]